MNSGKWLINEILFWLSLFCALTGITGVFAFSGDRTVMAIFLLVFAVFTVATVVFLKRLVRSGRSPLSIVLKKISAKLSAAASALFKHIARKRERRAAEKNYLKGRDFHSFGGEEEAGKKRGRAAKMRWNGLGTRDRIRFLYRGVIIKRRKKGVAVSPGDTPLEQIETLSMNAPEADVAVAYTRTRWNGGCCDYTDAEVAAMRERLGNG